MDKEFLKALLSELEATYESLIPIGKKDIDVEPEFIIEVYEYLAIINDFIDNTLLPLKDNFCFCHDISLFDKIIFFRDKITELLKPLELKALQNEFTSKMFKTHSTVLFERKMGFLVDKDTYAKILSYIQLNNFESYKPDQFNIVVKHPALPYTVEATVKPRGYLTRVVTTRTNYSLATAPYLYINEAKFNDTEIHGISVMNYSDNWRFLDYFVIHAAMLKSSIVELVDLEDVPMNLLYGNESTISSITEKDMDLHDFIKFVFNKSLASANYNKRYYMVKYKDDTYLFRDNEQPEEKALLIAKDDKTLTDTLHTCKCRHLIRP